MWHMLPPEQALHLKQVSVGLTFKKKKYFSKMYFFNRISCYTSV